MTNIIIGVIGPIGSGKDAAAEYIASKLSSEVQQISQPLKELANQRGIEPTRENLIALGVQLAQERGEDYLAKYLVEHMSGVGIISGMRQLAQIEFLRRCERFILIAITAKPQIRFDRSKSRGKLGEADTLGEFISREEQENSGAGPQRLFECMKLADYTINNDGSIEELHDKLDDLLKEESLFGI